MAFTRENALSKLITKFMGEEDDLKSLAKNFRSIVTWAETVKDIWAIRNQDALPLASEWPEGTLVCALNEYYKQIGGAWIRLVDETDLTFYALKAGAVMDGDAAGGVLSGTYPSPGFAVDMATQAELNAHAAAADPHTGYVLESIVDAAADLIVASGADAVTRLAKGTALQVLRVNAGATALEYATPAAVLTGSAASLTWGGQIGGQAGVDRTVTVTGAAVGDVAMASPQTTLGATGIALVWCAWVSSANTVTVRLVNSGTGAVSVNTVAWNVVVIPV